MPAQRFPTAYILLEDFPDQRLEFQVFPDEITETKAADWAGVPIIGRAEPYKVYASSSARIFTFTLAFFASVDSNDGGLAEDVQQSIRFLRSLLYPDEIGGRYTPPPLCRLIIGDLVNSRVVASNMNISYKGPWELSSESIGSTAVWLSLPHQAEATITMEEVNTTPPTSSEVRFGSER